MERYFSSFTKTLFYNLKNISLAIKDLIMWQNLIQVNLLFTPLSLNYNSALTTSYNVLYAIYYTVSFNQYMILYVVIYHPPFNTNIFTKIIADFHLYPGDWEELHSEKPRAGRDSVSCSKRLEQNWKHDLMLTEHWL